MRVLVCGSRDWDDADSIRAVLDGLDNAASESADALTVIEGCARGADSIASDWCDDNKAWVTHERYPANWKEHGKAAGPIRNQQMLAEGKPDVVWAFKSKPVSIGTDDMLDRAHRAGIPAFVVEFLAPESEKRTR